jgi:hypothetical protein
MVKASDYGGRDSMEVEGMVGMGDDVFLTRTEAAALMRLNPRTLANLAAQHAGPPYMKTARLRGKTLYRRSEVVRYMEVNGRGHAASSSPATSPAKQTTRRRKAAAT